VEWEYTMENIVFLNTLAESIAKVKEQLNGLGNRGWELVSILPTPRAPGNYEPPVGGMYIFKRPKQVIGAPIKSNVPERAGIKLL